MYIVYSQCWIWNERWQLSEQSGIPFLRYRLVGNCYAINTIAADWLMWHCQIKHMILSMDTTHWLRQRGRMTRKKPSAAIPTEWIADPSRADTFNTNSDQRLSVENDKSHQAHGSFYLSNTTAHMLDWNAVAERTIEYLSRKQLRKRRFHRHMKALDQDPAIASNVVHAVARVVCTSGPFSGGMNTMNRDQLVFLLPVKMGFLHKHQKSVLLRMRHKLRRTSPADLMLYGVILVFIASYVVAISVGVSTALG